MSAQHTPGPWMLEPSYGGGFEVMAQDKETAATLVLCSRGAWTHRARMSEANGRLIAAAPELLEALRMARDMISVERQSFADCNVVPELSEGDDPDNFISIGGALFEQHDADVVADYDRAMAKIDAAIAKTTGAAS